jgi:parallel beta-helix repeat protein
MKIQRGYFTSILFALAAIALVAVPSARAMTPVTTCGQTLSSSGEYILSGNLNCSGSFADGVDITANNVIFHLAGHTISSTDCDGTKAIEGIAVLGVSGVKVEGGTVQGFNDGVYLGATHARVTGMTVTGACFFGIPISGQGNQVDTSVVTLSGVDGVGIGAATETLIVGNDISGNARLGIDIANNSNNNVIKSNIINNNGLISGQGGIAIFYGVNNLIENNVLNNNLNGIELESPGNTARGNTVNGSLGDGIFVLAAASPSRVLKNTVLGSNFVDLSDDSATCSGDTWKGNTFQTDLAGGNPDGGPKVGCIR